MASEMLGPGNAAFEIPGYRLVAKIGEGGMGEVYKAVQVGSQRTVAVKFLNPALTVTHANTHHIRRAVVGPSTQGAHITDLDPARGQVISEEAARVQHAVAERAQALEAFTPLGVQRFIEQQRQRSVQSLRF